MKKRENEKNREQKKLGLQNKNLSKICKRNK